MRQGALVCVRHARPSLFTCRLPMLCPRRAGTCRWLPHRVVCPRRFPVEASPLPSRCAHGACRGAGRSLPLWLALSQAVRACPHAPGGWRCARRLSVLAQPGRCQPFGTVYISWRGGVPWRPGGGAGATVRNGVRFVRVCTRVRYGETTPWRTACFDQRRGVTVGSHHGPFSLCGGLRRPGPQKPRPPALGTCAAATNTHRLWPREHSPGRGVGGFHPTAHRARHVYRSERCAHKPGRLATSHNPLFEEVTP